MPQSFTSLNYHIVFSTKNRIPLITPEYELRLHEYIGGIVRTQGGVALAIGGMPDHVHVLARMRQDQALSHMIRGFKAGATGWMHDIFPELEEFAWQNGYGAFTVSQSLVAKVKEYVDTQHEHHRKRTFKDEFIALLKAHEIPFDERYVFA
jgi:putative transposase